MAQAFNIQGKPAMDKNMIVKYGPAAGGGIAIFGLLLTGLGFILPVDQIVGCGIPDVIIDPVENAVQILRSFRQKSRQTCTVFVNC